MRIRASLPTLRLLLDNGATAVRVCSHLGRPKTEADHAKYSMTPVRERLAELLPDDRLTLLENTRFDSRETKNDPSFARELAEGCDVYVNDAFGTAHRAHASTEGVAHLLPCAAGRLMEREVRALTGIIDRPARPLVAVLGGAKATDKIALVEHFLELADSVLIGGAMSFPFLAAQGHAIGASPCLQADVDCARQALMKAAETHHSLELPEDFIV